MALLYLQLVLIFNGILSNFQAVGEPPLFLATSVYFAIKDAIQARRSDLRIVTQPRLVAPLTAERIRMACEDKITALVPKYSKDERWCQQL